MENHSPFPELVYEAWVFESSDLEAYVTEVTSRCATALDSGGFASLQALRYELSKRYLRSRRRLVNHLREIGSPMCIRLSDWTAHFPKLTAYFAPPHERDIAMDGHAVHVLEPGSQSRAGDPNGGDDHFIGDNHFILHHFRDKIYPPSGLPVVTRDQLATGYLPEGNAWMESELKGASAHIERVCRYGLHLYVTYVSLSAYVSVDATPFERILAGEDAHPGLSIRDEITWMLLFPIYGLHRSQAIDERERERVEIPLEIDYWFGIESEGEDEDDRRPPRDKGAELRRCRFRRLFVWLFETNERKMNKYAPFYWGVDAPDKPDGEPHECIRDRDASPISTYFKRQLAEMGKELPGTERSDFADEEAKQLLQELDDEFGFSLPSMNGR